MPSIFVSYKRNHAPSDEVVSALESELQGAFQILRDQTMDAGKPWSQELYSWLLECDVGIAVVSEEANTADWCRREWSVLAARAQTTGLLVIPIYVGEHTIATGILDDRQAIRWRSPDALPRLRKQLSELKARSPSAKDFLAAHQAWLRWQFNEERVFGREPYALREVYIDTECGEQLWQNINVPRDERADPFSEKVGGRKNLIETTLACLSDKSQREPIVVQAGPGSGKSAFTLRIAHELIERGFTPIVVRFRDLRLATHAAVDEAIEDAIRIGHTEDDACPVPAGLLSGLFGEECSLNGTKICRTIVILDGWDEVSLTGNVSYQAQLQQWLPRLREFFVLHRGHAPIRLLLTGRPSSEVGESGVLKSATPVLTIRPMRPKQLRDYADKIQARLVHSPAATWTIDPIKLEPVFAVYEKWFDAYSKGADTSDATYGDVLGNPLLAYLSLRVIGESKRNPTELVSEPTALYHDLIEATVEHAGKGTDAELDNAVHRGGAGLRRLLQEVASTITILRTESVSYNELQARFEDPNLPVQRSDLAKWTKTPDTKNALRELVVNFYFKGGNRDFGCEFLHKSFREYLFAEAIVEALRAASQLERPALYDGLEYWQDFEEGTSAYQLSRRLGYLLAPQWLSRDIEGHLVWLMRSAAKREPEVWQRIRGLVTEVYAWWAEGVHLRHQPHRSRSAGGRWRPPFVDQLFCQTVPLAPDIDQAPVRTTVLDAHLGHALMRIACALYENVPQDDANETGRRKDYCSRHDGMLRFRPGRGAFMASLIARISSEGWSTLSLDSFVFGPIDLGGEIMTMTLGGASLKLSKALLSGSNFHGSILVLADFSGASMAKANLRFSHLLRANFKNANLKGADLKNADLKSADLNGADLNGANLENTNLENSKLQSANLASASLKGADLRQANLMGANLTDAGLENANVQGANFTDAIVEFGAFRRALNWEAVVGMPKFVEMSPKKALAQ